MEASAVAILNTCTVTATADAEVRQFVRRIHRRNPHCRILVTGCYAQRAPQEIAALEGVAWVVGNSHKHLVSEILAKSGDPKIGRSDEHFQTDAHPVSAAHLVHIGSPESGSQFSSQERGRISPSPDHPIARSPIVMVGAITDEFHFAPVFADDRTRPTLKIQDGCDARCSFCIIPTVRGQSRSLPPEPVIEQVRELEGAGYHEVVLSGINLGAWGRDLAPRLNFLGLLERLLTETAIARLRISSIEPMDVSPALIRLVATEPRIAQHLHVPLQSGCDRILRRMNRRYWARHYAERLAAIHAQIPNAGIGGDVMVGFPGETAADHEASLRFIASLPYTYLHIFPFSARPGTPAAAAAEQVNGRVARERGKEIRAVIDAKHQAFLAAQVGRSLPALTLDETEEDTRIALTTNYLKVLLPGGAIPANRLVHVQVGRFTSGKLFGWATTAASTASSPVLA